MQINLDCLKDVLLYCANNIKYKESHSGWTVDRVSLDILYEASELNKYNHADIMYSVLKLKECNYISIFSCYPENDSYLNRCSIQDVTMQGHRFLNTVKEPKIWNKTKSIISKVGNHTLEFVESVAHDIAVESAKEFVKGIAGQS